MSHGPFGLGGAALGPAPADCDLVNVEPTSVSASVRKSAGVILVFMMILSV
jgi:hypothetical protein